MAESTEVVWDHPGRSSCLSTIGCSSGGSIPEVGAQLRCGDLLGVVVEGRVHGGLPIHRSSAKVKCTYSTKDTDLTTEHVWHIPGCQVLTGELLKAALNDPSGFLDKFKQIEDRFCKPNTLRKVPPRKKK